MKSTSPVRILVALLCFLVVSPLAAQEAPKKENQEKKAETEMTSDVPAALNFTMKTIQGEDVNLAKYHGNVVVFVNVASECGYTKHYKQLQELHDEYAEDGLSIIGIPCNQFGGQEPGTNEEIVEFCESKFGVKFDLMDKCDVKGDTKCDLYKHLTRLDLQPKGQSEVRWNFEKIILNRKGEPIARFATKVSPDSKEFVKVITDALDEEVAAAPASYMHKSSKGTAYYLFSQNIKLRNSNRTWTSYFFSKSADSQKGDPLASVPAGWEVSETKSGMLVLKKSRKK